MFICQWSALLLIFLNWIRHILDLQEFTDTIEIKSIEKKWKRKEKCLQIQQITKRERKFFTRMSI